MNNVYGVLSATVFIIIILIISIFFEKRSIFSEEGTRKFVHIGVSNYWFIAMYFFDSPYWASIVPALFIVINSLSYRFSLLSSMERSDEKKSGLGTIYYPVSLTILTLFTFSTYSSPFVGALGMLSMGYGDGLAAIFGRLWGKRSLPCFLKKKTVLGTLTMFVVTFMISSAILYVYRPNQTILIPLTLALLGTIFEAMTPNGLDNITVPLGISFIYQWLFY